jgi:hypothetical protein
MAGDLPSPRETGLYYALAQVGLEMVAPIALGAYLDYRWGWLPWLTAVGAVVGFVGGFMHLFVLLRKVEKLKRERREGPR